MLSFHLTVSLILLYLLWYTLNIATKRKNKKPKQKGKRCNLKYSLVLTMYARNSTSSLFTSFTVLLPEEKKHDRILTIPHTKFPWFWNWQEVIYLNLCSVKFSLLHCLKFFYQTTKNPKWLTCSGPVIIKHFLRLSFIIQILGCNHL